MLLQAELAMAPPSLITREQQASVSRRNEVLPALQTFLSPKDLADATRKPDQFSVTASSSASPSSPKTPSTDREFKTPLTPQSPFLDLPTVEEHRSSSQSTNGIGRDGEEVIDVALLGITRQNGEDSDASRPEPSDWPLPGPSSPDLPRLQPHTYVQPRRSDATYVLEGGDIQLTNSNAQAQSRKGKEVERLEAKSKQQRQRMRKDWALQIKKRYLQEDISQDHNTLENNSNGLRISLHPGNLPNTQQDAEPMFHLQDLQQKAKTPQSDGKESLWRENMALRTEIQRLKSLLQKQEENSGAKKVKWDKSGSGKSSSAVTLRELMMNQLFRTQVQHEQKSAKNCSSLPDALTLDTVLSSDQIREFSELLGSITSSSNSKVTQAVSLCAICELPKFKASSRSGHASVLWELKARHPQLSTVREDFHPNWTKTTCCKKSICKSCLSEAVIRGITSKWWQELWRGCRWLSCPACGSSLALDYNCDILDLLQDLGAHNALSYARKFERASELRDGLQLIHPPPSSESLRIFFAIHQRLQKGGLATKLLENESYPFPRASVQIGNFSVDSMDGQTSLRVPIFTHLLQPLANKECIVCAETFAEFESGSNPAWAATTSEFPGDWQWEVFFFPTPDLLPACTASHAPTICRDCLATHIATQLESLGRGAVDRIRCPHPDCSLTYTHREIRLLADPEVFTAYDRYTVLNTLCLLPNFRWCLRSGCNSGGLYDDAAAGRPSTFIDPIRIMCTECAFEMCFEHEVPWHRGLTCGEFDTAREHGDPRVGLTREWIEKNTKACPGAGCGVPVQKGAGCFHMTCAKCRYEFCWECLANWHDIVDRARGVLREGGAGHREGCYFRIDGAVAPTHVMGRTLEGGLQRLGQRVPTPAPPPPPVVAPVIERGAAAINDFHEGNMF